MPDELNINSLTGFSRYAKILHEHFGIAYEGKPRFLSEQYMHHKFGQLSEEMNEIGKGIRHGKIEEIVDGLGDLMVVANGILEQMGVDSDAVMQEIMKANLGKELGRNPKRNTHDLDLIKPDGWSPPDIKSLVSDRQNHGYAGIIVLEGADCTGKTTLAKYLEDNYGAYYAHHTWSKELNADFHNYMVYSFLKIINIARDQLVVVDRAWLSYEVYGRTINHYDPKSNVQDTINRVLDESKAVTIMCLSDDSKALQSRFDNSEDEMYDSVIPVSDKYNLVWGAGVKGINNGKPLNQHPRYVKYSIEEHGDNMGVFVASILRDFGYTIRKHPNEL